MFYIVMIFNASRKKPVLFDTAFCNDLFWNLGHCKKSCLEQIALPIHNDASPSAWEKEPLYLFKNPLNQPQVEMYAHILRLPMACR